MELTYRQLEALLVAHFRILPDRTATFRSRVKQLQRLEFPTGINIGRGSKMVYSAEHLFKIVCAFELIGCGLAAQPATQLVEEHWPALARGFGHAMRFDMIQRLNPEVFARFIVRRLGDLMVSDGYSRPEARVIIEDRPHQTSILSRNTERSAYSYIVLCLSDIYSRVAMKAVDIVGASFRDFFDEIVNWLPVDYDADDALFSPDPEMPLDRVSRRLARLLPEMPIEPVLNRLGFGVRYGNSEA